MVFFGPDLNVCDLAGVRASDQFNSSESLPVSWHSEQNITLEGRRQATGSRPIRRS